MNFNKNFVYMKYFIKRKFVHIRRNLQIGFYKEILFIHIFDGNINKYVFRNQRKLYA